MKRRDSKWLVGTVAFALALGACSSSESLLDPAGHGGTAGTSSGKGGATSGKGGASSGGVTGHGGTSGGAGTAGTESGGANSSGGAGDGGSENRGGSPSQGGASSGGASTGGRSSGGSTAMGGHVNGGTGTGGTGTGGTVSKGGNVGAGGTAGAAQGGTSGNAGTAGVGGCPSGQMWCPGCTAGTGFCSAVCPGEACNVCDTLTTREACDASAECHSVFVDPNTCGCASKGCCAKFSRCVRGKQALCTPPATLGCEAPTPFCDSPAYVVSYTATCYEGCVAPADCAP